jgi:hypothetical protein
MSPADRESVRLVLDQADTPEDALARKIIARPVFEFDLKNPLEIDNCDMCGAPNWRECACVPNAQQGGAP